MQSAYYVDRGRYVNKKYANVLMQLINTAANIAHHASLFALLQI